MAFSLTTVTHTFLNPDGTAASGTVRFSLSGRMTNGIDSIEPSEPITVTLNATGQMTVSLASNLDASTVSSDTWPHYDVTISLVGARSEEYSIQVPTSGPVDLFTLIPSTFQVQ